MEFLTIEHLSKTYGKGENAVKALEVFENDTSKLRDFAYYLLNREN